MAQKLIPGVNIFTDFTNGQSVGAPNYFTYAPDMDVSYSSITTTVNQIIDEITSIQGQNAVLQLDIATVNDPLSPDFSDDALMGLHSYLPTAGVGTNQIDVAPGSALATGLRVVSATPLTLTIASGSSTGTYYIALDVNGFPSVESLPNQKTVDIYSVDYTTGSPGTIDFGTLTPLVNYAIDGDSWRKLQEVSGDSDAFTTNVVYAEPVERFEAIERLLGGFNTDRLGNPVGPIGIPGGSAADPQLRPANGSGVQDGSGFFRSAANVLGWAAGGTEILRFSGVGLEALALNDPTKPSITFIGDLDTGLYWPGADQLAITTNGTQAQVVNATQQRTSPTQGRLAATATGETHDSGTGTWDVVDVDNGHILYDVAGYHAGGSPSTITVPTGANGNYSVKAWARFAANVTGQRGIRITAGGNVVAEMFVEAAGAGVTTVTCSADVDLVATNTVVIEVYQSSGGNLGFDYRTSLRLED